MSLQIGGEGGEHERQGPAMVEFTIEIGGEVTTDGIDAILEALERAATLAVSRLPNAQIDQIMHAVG